MPRAEQPLRASAFLLFVPKFVPEKRRSPPESSRRPTGLYRPTALRPNVSVRSVVLVAASGRASVAQRGIPPVIGMPRAESFRRARSHAKRRPLVVANACHSPSYGCASRLARPPFGMPLGHARKLSASEAATNAPGRWKHGPIILLD